MRAAFGKKTYTMEQVEKTVVDALKNGCSRFDLYFMTGIRRRPPSICTETTEYVEHLYEVVGHDKRLLCFTSPMARLLEDPGSISREPRSTWLHPWARTLEEHRQRLVLPSWKHIIDCGGGRRWPDEMWKPTTPQLASTA